MSETLVMHHKHSCVIYLIIVCKEMKLKIEEMHSSRYTREFELVVRPQYIGATEIAIILLYMYTQSVIRLLTLFSGDLCSSS